jgi:hypothetical protein
MLIRVFGSDRDTGRSAGGFVFLWGSSRLAYHSVWLSSCYPSSCESEIAALYFSVSMALWLRKLVQFFGYSDGPTVIAEDNQGASTYCESMDRAGRMKHIDVKYFWIREHQRI